MADTPDAVGFDVLAARIRKIQFEIRPGYGNVKTAVSWSSRGVRESFTKGLGKRTVETTTSAPPARRRAGAAVAAVVTPLDNCITPFQSSRYIASTDSFRSVIGASPSRAMLIGDRDTTVPHHHRRRASVLQHVYKRLPPEEIVRLFPGDQIIVVIPAHRPKSSNDNHAIVESRGVIDRYRRYFSKVIDSTIKQTFAGDRATLVSDTIDEIHTFLREDVRFLEFECRAVNYPLRETLESKTFDMRSLDHNWDQGAGINLAVCGYTSRQTVLMQLQHVAYLEIYKLTPPESFATDSIIFPANITKQEKLVPPLVSQLSLFNGCPFSTIEILWKYYRSLSTARERRLTYVSKLLDAARQQSVSSDDAMPYDECDDSDFDTTDLLSVVDCQLSPERINEFVGVVEAAYKNSFLAHYSGFQHVDCYLVDRSCIRHMYTAMTRLFPFVHAVLALTVSNPRSDCVDVFCNTQTAQPDEDMTNDGLESNTLELSRRERAVLEFFIAKIRLRSQRAMKYWAMVPTLGTHSRGYIKTIPTHPVHGCGCSMPTLWSTLNDMFDSASPGRMDVIRNQYTVSVAFDNWQQMIQKMWQTSGSSSNYLKGVASFAKKDKAVLLPINSILKSPLGLRFRVLETEFIDAYSTRIRGELLSGVGDGSDNTESSDEVEICSGALIWPRIGWEVQSLFGVTDWDFVSYVEPIIPPPINACVRSSQSTDDLIFGRREFCRSGEHDTRTITSDEYNTHILDCEDIIILNTFMGIVNLQHERKKEEDLIREEDGEEQEEQDIVVDVDHHLPNHFENERVFVNHMEKSSYEIYNATMFRSDMVAMVADKAAKEVWGIPKTRDRIRGTSQEDDIIDLEKFLDTCEIFVSHEKVMMRQDFFWNVVEPRMNVGSPRDKSKTTLPFDEHEQEFHRRVIVGVFDGDEIDICNDDDNRDDSSFMTTLTNDDSICHSLSEGVRPYDIGDDFELDSEELILSKEQRKEKISTAMKKLGNMKRKQMDKNATMDAYAKGGLLLGAQEKSRKKAIAKVEGKRDLIYQSMDYFDGQLTSRREHLEECIIRSADPSTRFVVPSYKQLYHERMGNM